MIRKHLHVLEPPRFLLVLAILSLFVAEVFPFLYPLVLEKAIDQIQGKVIPHSWIEIFILYLGLVILHSVFLYLRIFFGQKLSILSNHKLRLKVFAHLQNLPVSLVQKRPVGDWISRVTNDTESYGNIFGEGILELTSNLALLLFSMVFMLMLDLRLGLATILVLPAMIAVAAWYRQHFRNLQARVRDSLANITAFLQEMINGVGIIQVFQKQHRIHSAFDQVNRSYMDSTLRYAKQYAGFFPLIQSLSDLSLLCCYTAGAWLISNGEISAGLLAAFAWYASIYSRPLRDVSERINSIQTSLAAGDRVREFLAFPAETRATDLKRELQSTPLSIEFNDVEFGYTEERKILDGVTFQLPQGSKTALVGNTGCGKSTTFQLILGFYSPQQGTILVEGFQPAYAPRELFHQDVAWLSQDPYLFPGSIRENICLGNAWNEQRFNTVCRQAQLTSLLERLPQGADTACGLDGDELSSGQRQLICYARTLYQNPKLLLLDEPSSAIDPDTAHRLETAFVELVQGRTALVVSHKLSTVLACDHVLFMENGRIVEQGTPASLQNNPESRFSMLFRETP